MQQRQRRQLEAHIWAYADMLLAWDLPHKRAELLQSMPEESGLSHAAIADMLHSTPLGQLTDMLNARLHSRLTTGVVRSCPNCGLELPYAGEYCSCGTRQTASRCAVCRLPIKGTRVFR